MSSFHPIMMLDFYARVDGNQKARKISLIDAKILYNESHPNQPKESLSVYMWDVFEQLSSIYESKSESSL